MILTSGELVRTLNHIGDDFITVELFGQEYIIDCVAHRKNYTDNPCSHITLKCRNGGKGEIKR